MGFVTDDWLLHHDTHFVSKSRLSDPELVQGLPKLWDMESKTDDPWILSKGYDNQWRRKDGSIALYMKDRQEIDFSTSKYYHKSFPDRD
jgi:hypothetical protein